MRRMMQWMVVGAFCALSTMVRAEDDDKYVTLAQTFSGKIGAKAAVVELISAKDRGIYLGRFAILEDGRDVPLISGGAKADGPHLVLKEEAPCTAKTCQSIVPERDDELGDLAPGTAPIAATWTMTLSADGKSLTGTRKDRKSGKTAALAFAYAGERKIFYDCCTGADIGSAEWDHGQKMSESEPYEAIRTAFAMTKGDTVETLDGATYRLDHDKRIAADFPVFLTLPGKSNIEAVNQWLTERRMATFAVDFECASRRYHRFRWNKANDGLLKTYQTQSSASVEFVSDKLVAIEKTAVNQCEPDAVTETAYLMADTATGETVHAGELMKDFHLINNIGDPAEIDEGGDYAPMVNVIREVNALRKAPSADNPEKCNPEKQMMQTRATFRGRNLVFEIPSYDGDGVDCAEEDVTIPLEKAGHFLNDKGKAYLADLIK